jgi:hypothetical protein
MLRKKTAKVRGAKEAKLPGDTGTLKTVTGILYTCVKTGSAPCYLYSFAVCERMTNRGWLSRGTLGDFHVYTITEAGREAFSLGKQL